MKKTALSLIGLMMAVFTMGYVGCTPEEEPGMLPSGPVGSNPDNTPMSLVGTVWYGINELDEPVKLPDGEVAYAIGEYLFFRDSCSGIDSFFVYTNEEYTRTHDDGDDDNAVPITYHFDGHEGEITFYFRVPDTNKVDAFHYDLNYDEDYKMLVMSNDVGVTHDFTRVK